MVAFTGGIKYRLQNSDSDFQEQFRSYKKSGKLDNAAPELRQLVRRTIEPLTYGVAGNGTGLALLPENYMGDDGEENDIVTAKTMFEGKSLVEPKIPQPRKGKKTRGGNKKKLILGAREIDSREAYAEWLTEPENPRFTKVMANRLWKQAMGMGLIEPVDDMTKLTKASNPELMDYLTATFEELDYDMKQFQRAIYNSRTYQSRAMREDVPDPSKFYFNGPIVRRMAAEQIWDSLLTLIISDVDKRVALKTRSRYGMSGASGDIYQQYEQLKQMPVSEIIANAEKALENRGNRKSPQMRMMQAEKNKSQSVRNQLKQLDRKIAKSRRDGDKKEMLSLSRQRNKLAQKVRSDPKVGFQLNRASEISSPAPSGHFLREFGQSDRETIQNAVTAPAVTHALSLMNGVLEYRIAKNPSTVLMQNIASTDDPEEAVEIVFLSMLNRKPNTNELVMWTRDFKSERIEVVLGDLIWTLANSNEFIFIK